MFTTKVHNKTWLYSVVSSVLLVFLVACESSEKTDTPEPVTEEVKEEVKDAKVEEPKMISPTTATSEIMRATVRYIDIEGGFYGLETKDGEKYLPKNLDDNLKADGTIIQFKVTPVTGVMTTQQWGQLVTLSEVTLIKKVDDMSDL